MIDAALPQLDALVDTEFLSKRVGFRLDNAVVVRHKPGRRALVRYDTDQGQLLAKLRSGHRAGTPFGLMRRFRAAGFTAPACVRVAEPVACLPELDTWIQRLVPGCHGEEALLAEPLAMVEAAAQAAATIHGSALPARRCHDLAAELRILDVHLDRLRSLRPDLDETIDSIHSRCRALASTLGPRPTAWIHRDFYPDQLLLGADHVTVVDFDLYCLGDPALDIGNFTAHVRESVRRIGADPAAADSAADHAVTEYLRRAGTSHRRAIAVYEALSLARLAALSVQLPGRGHTTDALIALLYDAD